MSEEQEFHSWKPEKQGDEVSGRLVDVTSSVPNQYGTYPILTLDTGNGEVSIHAFHQVLRSNIARRRPRIGDELTIKYLGKVKSGQGADGYHNYRVTGGQAGTWNWDAELPEEMRETAADVEPDVPIGDEDLPRPRSEVEAAADAARAQAAAEQFGDDDDIPF